MTGIGEALYKERLAANNYNHGLAVDSTIGRARELALEKPTFLEELKKLIKAFRK